MVLNEKGLSLVFFSKLFSRNSKNENHEKDFIFHSIDFIVRGV